MIENLAVRIDHRDFGRYFRPGLLGQAVGWIQQKRALKSVVMRVLVRGVLILAHNVVVIVVVDLWFSVWPGAVLPLAIPGLLLWMLDANSASTA